LISIDSLQKDKLIAKRVDWVSLFSIKIRKYGGAMR
jgi:hypothetical protein